MEKVWDYSQILLPPLIPNLDALFQNSNMSRVSHTHPHMVPVYVVQVMQNLMGLFKHKRVEFVGKESRVVLRILRGRAGR